MPPTQTPSDFLALVNDWLVWLEHNRGRSPKTIDGYLAVLERLVDWVVKPPDAKHLRASSADPFTLQLEDIERFAGLYCYSQGLSARSRRVFVSALRGFYAWASQAKKLPANIADALAYPKAGRPLPRALSLENADRLLRQPDLATFLGLRDTTIMAMLIGTGLRISGLVALNESSLIWTHLDGVEDLVIRTVEKGEKERLVPVPREAALLVRAYLGHPDLAEIDRLLPNADSVLFVSIGNRTVPAWDYRGDARRISEYGVRDILAKHGKSAGVPKDQLNPHAMRHLYGTELGESDVDLIKRQALMGHASADSTEIYTRLAMRRLRETVDKANPLGKMRTPLLEDLRNIARAERPRRASAHPNGPDKS